MESRGNSKRKRRGGRRFDCPPDVCAGWNFTECKYGDAIACYVNPSGFFCVNYLVDFLVMGGGYATCRAAQLFLHDTLRRVGFYLSYEKVRSPSQIQLYLGVELDSTTMQLRLPQGKLDNLAEEIAFFDGRRRTTKKQLQRLCGILSHCSTLVRGAGHSPTY